MKLKRILRRIKNRSLILLTAVSPELNAKVVHYFKTGHRLDLNDPKTFTDKLTVLKIRSYNHDPLVKRCADKYRARDYVKEKGHGDILNELIAVYDDVEDIEWEKLPKQFAMKWNFGSGHNIICADKDKLDIDSAKSKMKKWKNSRQHLQTAQLQYEIEDKKILVERYLNEKEGVTIPDIKLYCFHGKCRAILYIAERDRDPHRAAFFDENWEYLGQPYRNGVLDRYNSFEVLPKRPERLEEMVRIAEDLSSGFPFVRIDLYDVNGRIVFGEMTFTPATSHEATECLVHGTDMADLI